jgi:hypothetical protein
MPGRCDLETLRRRKSHKRRAHPADVPAAFVPEMDFARAAGGELLGLAGLPGARVITVTAEAPQTTQAGTSLSPSGTTHVGETRVPSSG